MKNKLTDVVMVGVQEDLYDAGYHPEDGPGLPYGSNNRAGSVFLIVVETEDGFRFQNTVTFSDDLHIESDEEGRSHWCYGNRNAGQQAQDYSNYIQAHLERGGKLDEKHWTPIQGCYGSAGWDEQIEIDFEMRQLEEEGWR